MEGATPQWWERERGTLLQLCREAAPSSLCREYTRVTTECDYTEDPATGEPLKRCVKLYKRYLTCAGKPEKVDERWEAAQELSDLGTGRVESPSGHPGPQIEDVGHAVQEFLRFAEELQEQLVPGAIHLDQVPAAAARPYSDAEAQQEQQQQQQQQQQQAFGWLGGLLFGRRRASADAGGGQKVDASTWREFEREFTEV